MAQEARTLRESLGRLRENPLYALERRRQPGARWLWPVPVTALLVAVALTRHLWAFADLAFILDFLVLPGMVAALAAVGVARVRTGGVLQEMRVTAMSDQDVLLAVLVPSLRLPMALFGTVLGAFLASEMDVLRQASMLASHGHGLGQAAVNLLSLLTVGGGLLVVSAILGLRAGLGRHPPVGAGALAAGGGMALGFLSLAAVLGCGLFLELSRPWMPYTKVAFPTGMGLCLIGGALVLWRTCLRRLGEMG